MRFVTDNVKRHAHSLCPSQVHVWYGSGIATVRGMLAGMMSSLLHMRRHTWWVTVQPASCTKRIRLH